MYKMNVSSDYGAKWLDFSLEADKVDSEFDYLLNYDGKELSESQQNHGDSLDVHAARLPSC